MNGEDAAARDQARASVRTNHQKPLPRDARFVEAVLQSLVDWLARTPAPPADALSFVHYDFNLHRPAASLGPERRVRTDGPATGGMHLCADPLGTVHLVRAGMSTAVAHSDALTTLQLAPRATVIFEPTSRIAKILCDGLPWPGADLRLADVPAQPWSIADLDQTVGDFHYDRLAPTPLLDLVMNGDRLRRNGRGQYHEALYLYLRFERGLSRQAGCEVRLGRDALELIPRGGGREQVKAFGRRADPPYPPQIETAELRRRAARLAVKHAIAGKPRLNLRCLCCDDANLCAAAAKQNGFTLEHVHLRP